LHDITGTDPKENTASDPLLVHDVITGTDPKENTSTKQTTKKMLVASIVAWLLVARQHPLSVDFVGPQCARHNINYCVVLLSIRFL
jgi:hypothetical protein